MHTRDEQIKYFQKHQESIFGHMAIRSGRPGPHLLVIGGTHGDEPCGVEGILEWHQYLKQSKGLLRGEIHFLLGNPEAFGKNLRYVDHDLNRSFAFLENPHEVKKSLYEVRRANELVSLLNELSPLDAVLDLHSVSKGDTQMMVYNRDQDGIFEFILQTTPMAVHFNHRDGDIHGLLIDKCKQISPRNFAIECGNHTDEYAKEVASFHIYRLLHGQQMVEELLEFEQKQQYVKTSDEVEDYETMYPIVPTKGFTFVVSHQETVSFLESDQVFAKSEERDYKAPQDCYLVMPPQKIRESDVDAGFLCQKYLRKRSSVVSKKSTNV